MKWYLAKFVYQVISGNGNHTPQFDEQMRLIRADEFAWAKEKASYSSTEEPENVNDYLAKIKAKASRLQQAL